MFQLKLLRFFEAFGLYFSTTQFDMLCLATNLLHMNVIQAPRLEPEDENVAVSLFDYHLSILQSTVAQKLVFSKPVQEAKDLEWIDHEALWVGPGAARYILSFHRKKPLVANGITHFARD